MGPEKIFRPAQDPVEKDLAVESSDEDSTNLRRGPKAPHITMVGFATVWSCCADGCCDTMKHMFKRRGSLWTPGAKVEVVYGMSVKERERDCCRSKSSSSIPCHYGGKHEDI